MMLLNKYFTKKGFLILLIALHIFGFAKQVIYPKLLTLDSDDYILLAENLMNYGLPYSGKIEIKEMDYHELDNKGLFASRPVLYSLFIWFTGGLNLGLFFTLFVQNVLSIAAILLIEKLVVAKGFKINYFIASIGILLFPSLWIYANWIMAETLFMFLCVVCIYFLLKNKPAYLWSAIFLVMAFYTKPVLVFIIYLWLIVFMVFAIKQKHLRYVFIALLPLIGLMVQLFINYYYTQAAIVSSMPGINLVQYNAYFTLSKTKGTEYANAWVKQTDSLGKKMESEQGFKASYNLKKNRAITVLKANIATYFWIHTQGSARFFIDPGRYDMLNFFNLFHEDGNQGWTRTYYQQGITGLLKRAMNENLLLLGMVLGVFLWNVFRLFLVVKNLRLMWKSRTLCIVFVAVVLYFAAISGPVATARFLLPVFPLLLFWSSLAEKQNVRP